MPRPPRKVYQGHACNELGCWVCVLAFYRWAQSHTNGSPRSRRGPKTALTFYEAAALRLGGPGESRK